MPWQGVCPMDLRMRLVTAMLAEEDSMTALCEEYGVSRKTGYKWLARYRAAAPDGLGGRSSSAAARARGWPPRAVRAPAGCLQRAPPVARAPRTRPATPPGP